MKNKFLTLSIALPILLASGHVHAEENNSIKETTKEEMKNTLKSSHEENTVSVTQEEKAIPQNKTDKLEFNTVTGIQKIEKTRTVDKKETYTEKVEKTRMVDKQENYVEAVEKIRKVPKTTAGKTESPQILEPKVAENAGLVLHGKAGDSGANYYKNFSLVAQNTENAEFLATPIVIKEGSAQFPNFTDGFLGDGESITTKNVATTVSGKTLDLKITAKYEKRVSAGGPTTINFDKTEGIISAYQNSTGKVTYSFEFIDTATGKPVEIVGSFSFFDIDFNEQHEFSTEKDLVAYTPDTTHTLLNISGNTAKFENKRIDGQENNFKGISDIPKGSAVIGFRGSKLDYTYLPVSGANFQLFGVTSNVKAVKYEAPKTELIEEKYTENVTKTRTVKVPEKYFEDVTKTRVIKVPEKYTENKTVIERLRVELSKTNDTGKFDSVLLKDADGKTIDLKLTNNAGEFTPTKAGKYTIEYAVSSTGEKVIDFTVTVKTTQNAVNGVKNVASKTTRLESSKKGASLTYDLPTLNTFVTRFVDENNNDIKDKVIDTKSADKIDIQGYSFVKSENTPDGTKHIYRKNAPDVKTLPKTGEVSILGIGHIIGYMFTILGGFLFKKSQSR